MSIRIPQKLRLKPYWRVVALFTTIAMACALVFTPKMKKTEIPICRIVARLVEATTQGAVSEAHAFRRLEALGMEAVPCIVSHLDDMRPLPNPQISFTNRDPRAFEEYAQYEAELVHDALGAILRQITNEDIGVLDADRPSDQRDSLRQRSRHRWIVWCRTHYPRRVSDCGEVWGEH